MTPKQSRSREAYQMRLKLIDRISRHSWDKIMSGTNPDKWRKIVFSLGYGASLATTCRNLREG